MKKFLITVFLFLIILLAVWIAPALLGTFYYGNRVARATFQLLPQTKVISLANSYTQCAVDPETWPAYQNLSSSASSPWYWLAKLQRVLAQNPGHALECVLLSAHGFLPDHLISEREQFARYFPFSYQMADCWAHQETPFSMEVADQILSFKNIKRFRRKRGLIDAPPADSAIAAEVRLAGELRTALHPDRAPFTAGLASGDMREHYLPSFERIAEICNAHNIRLVILFPPSHANFLNRFMPEDVLRHHAAIKQFAERVGADYYTYDDAGFEDEDFRDISHLSRKGRQKFTQLLRRELGYGDDPAAPAAPK
jgi:hypothetical protein